MSKSYRKEELFSLGKSKRYTGDALAMLSFPLGGIGTGSVGLSGRGGLRDWEIFNRPNLNGILDFTYPLIWAKEKDNDPVCRVVMSPPLPPYQYNGDGSPHLNGEGYPHMDSATFVGEYPFANIDFVSKKLPVKVALEAYNPFIPSNADESGYPAAILKYSITNPKKAPVEVSLAWGLQNAVGSIGKTSEGACGCSSEFSYDEQFTERVNESGLKGLRHSSKKFCDCHPRFGSMALLTPNRNVQVMPDLPRTGWFAPKHEYWDTFSATGKLPVHEYDEPRKDNFPNSGSVAVREKLKPGETKTITFYITWYFPNYEHYICHPEVHNDTPKTWKNYYASQFDDAVDVASKLHKAEKRLYTESMTFHDALYSSTLPPFVIDAVSSQMAILKTATCLRLPDGTFYGFEGCSPGTGCCEGSCTHVWNYQQALPFLFPELERSMRTADYEVNTKDDGSMSFRIGLPYGLRYDAIGPCADGQNGGIIKLYRDWKISGDDTWLRHLWPYAQKALEFAWKDWDKDKDGVMTTWQHNTYDINFLGPNTMTGSFYLGALVAGAEIADYLGQPEKAAEYREVYEKGVAWIEKNLFNGEYYIQKYDPKEAEVYQYGIGCLSDQVLGHWLSEIAGLGPVMDKQHVRKALKSIFKYNWKSDLSEHANAQRVYALGDEAGLLLCSWPRGGRPAVPFVYSDEVWTGIEYQVASHLIIEGFLKEGLSIVKGVRDRHDGIRRNPWNEYECGSHYARAMASYGLLTAMAGFSYDKGLGVIGFAPQFQPENFKTFWALDGAWGTYAQKGKKASLALDYGTMTLSRLDLADLAGAKGVKVTVGKKNVPASIDEYGSVTFAKAVHLKAGKTVDIAAK